MNGTESWCAGFCASFLANAQNAHPPARRTLRDMQKFYADQQTVLQMLEAGDDPLIYEVYSWDAPEKNSDLSFGVTVLQPGCIGREYFMTKGHFHMIRQTAEVYYTLSGSGIMLTEDEHGHVNPIPMRSGEAAYVAPGFAHRMINTGDTPLTAFYVFRADAGHDYASIEKDGFSVQLTRGKDGNPVLPAAFQKGDSK